jgi:hypothetical protein
MKNGGMTCTWIVLLVSVAHFCAWPLAGQTPLLDVQHYIMPATPLNAGRLCGSVGVAVSMLPLPLTEYPAPAPMLDVRYRFGLPLNTMLVGKIGSNIATTPVQAGLLTSVPFGNLSVAAGAAMQYVYGNITYIYGFNTTQERWSVLPMIAASYVFEQLTATVRLEVEYVTSVARQIEGQRVVSQKNRLVGESMTVCLEQPFFGDVHLLVGCTVSTSTDPYQAWFLYNTFRDRLFMSEVFVGVIL